MNFSVPIHEKMGESNPQLISRYRKSSVGLESVLACEQNIMVFPAIFCVLLHALGSTASSNHGR